MALNKYEPPAKEEEVQSDMSHSSDEEAVAWWQEIGAQALASEETKRYARLVEASRGAS